MVSVLADRGSLRGTRESGGHRTSETESRDVESYDSAIPEVLVRLAEVGAIIDSSLTEFSESLHQALHVVVSSPPMPGAVLLPFPNFSDSNAEQVRRRMFEFAKSPESVEYFRQFPINGFREFDEDSLPAPEAFRAMLQELPTKNWVS